MPAARSGNRLRGASLMPRNFEAHYECWPFLVETFVDEVYGGSCPRSASFRSVGNSTSRGRRDMARRGRRTEKMVSKNETERAWEASSVWFAWIMWRCGQIRVWGARLSDECRSARLAKSTALLTACPEQKNSAGVAAINVAVTWRIMAMTLSGLRLPSCGSGMMFSVHEADYPYDGALVRDMRAPDRTRGAVRFGRSSWWLAGLQAQLGARKPDRVAPADPALDHLTRQTHRSPRRPEARIASRGTACCNAQLS